MASMFKKPKRNFRRKGGDADSDNENEAKDESTGVNEDISAVPKPVKEKRKKQESKDKESRSKTVLSFETEDDEGEVFRIKKSSISRRIAKQMKKERREKGKDGRNGQQVDTDDDDDSDERENEEIRKKKKKEEEEAKAEDTLQKLREEFRTLNGEDAEYAEGSDDDGQKTFKSMLARGEIPDAKTIHFIRKQRQMARETDNFIAIEDPDVKANKSSTARLIRDDDNDKSDDDDEEDMRVDFAVDKAAIERQQMRDDFLAAEHGSDEDSDHEREWEKQQIRKAVSLQIPGVDVPSSANSNDSSSVVSFFNSASMASGRATSQLGGMNTEETMKPFSAFSKLQNTSDITIESVRKCLQERLSTMDTVFRSHKNELEKIVTDIADAKESIESCEHKAPDLENRYRFFQELRGFL